MVQWMAELVPRVGYGNSGIDGVFYGIRDGYGRFSEVLRGVIDNRSLLRRHGEGRLDCWVGFGFITCARYGTSCLTCARMIYRRDQGTKYF